MRVPPLPPAPPENRIHCSVCGYYGKESGHNEKKHKRNEIIMPILFAVAHISAMILIVLLIIRI